MILGKEGQVKPHMFINKPIDPELVIALVKELDVDPLIHLQLSNQAFEFQMGYSSLITCGYQRYLCQ